MANRGGRKVLGLLRLFRLCLSVFVLGHLDPNCDGLDKLSLIFENHKNESGTVSGPTNVQ